MLFTIMKGNVEGYAGGEEPILHLVSAAQAVQREGGQYVFTDGHGIVVFTNFFEDLGELDQVDWTVMKATYWRDTLDDMDRCRRRQAEFLIHDFCPWQLIETIGVMTKKMKATVEELLEGVSHKPVVTVRREWYYS